jgi:serine phosphatase RsbU (regulator of sigma subunit)
VPKPIPEYLRLHVEPAAGGIPCVELYTGLPEFCQAFEQATGWPLTFVQRLPSGKCSGAEHEHQPMTQEAWSAPVEDSSGGLLGYLALAAPAGGQAQCDAAVARRLAAAVHAALNELQQLRHGIWLREAELAAGVPIVARSDEPQRLAERLEAVLRAGAEAVGCQAAGLYLLDVHTTELKLRSCWGLPRQRLLAPPRGLADAAADLEALAGHAVVLERADLLRSWNVPEEFASAVCVPISSPTVPLGTLWVFSHQPRTFSDAEMNLIEVVSGRLSVELERQTLLTESRRGTRLARQAAVAHQLRSSQLPHVAPLIDGWDLAGWASQPESLGGAFYDWSGNGWGEQRSLDGERQASGCEARADASPRETPHGEPRPHERVHLALGEATECLGLGAALVSQSIRSTWRAQAEHLQQPQELVVRINRALWAGSAGEQRGALLAATIEPGSGFVSYAWAGHPGALRVRGGSVEALLGPQCELGTEPDTQYALHHVVLEPGEALVFYNEQFRNALDERGRLACFAALADAMQNDPQITAQQLAELMAAHAERHAVHPELDDRAVLVARRLA